MYWLIVVYVTAVPIPAGSNETFASRSGCYDPTAEHEEEDYDESNEKHNRLLDGKPSATSTSTSTGMNQEEYSNGDDLPPPTKKHKASSKSSGTGTGSARLLVEQVGTNSVEDNPEFFGSATTMYLPYIGYCWKDEHLRKLITCTINLPSGLVHEGNNNSLDGIIIPSLSGENRQLVLKIQWPDCVTKVDLLKQGLSRTKTCGRGSDSLAQCVIGFREAVARLTKQLGGTIGTVVKIDLPYEVEKIEQFVPVRCKETSGYNLYVILKVKVQETHEQQYMMDFLDC
jgi:hypothetical protein